MPCRDVTHALLAGAEHGRSITIIDVVLAAPVVGGACVVSSAMRVIGRVCHSWNGADPVTRTSRTTGQAGGEVSET